MPKRKFDFEPGGYYHIYNRGANRQSIFREERNYPYLLRLLKQVLPECHITVVAYCLLPNHYHWLLRQNSDIPISKAVGRVWGSYSQAFNKAYEHTGTLFEGPFKALQVTTEDYLLRLCRYIHRNPVHHGFVAEPEDWPYSNYPEWIEQRPGTLVDRKLVREHFSTPQMYVEFAAIFEEADSFLEDEDA